MMLSQFLINMGFTRDSGVWLWSRLVAFALLVGSGLVPLDAYLSPKGVKAVQLGAIVVLWLAGKYDSSPLPGGKK